MDLSADCISTRMTVEREGREIVRRRSERASRECDVSSRDHIPVNVISLTFDRLIPSRQCSTNTTRDNLVRLSSLLTFLQTSNSSNAAFGQTSETHSVSTEIREG